MNNRKKKLMNYIDSLYIKLEKQITCHETAIDNGHPSCEYKDSCDILNMAISNANKTLELLSIGD